MKQKQRILCILLGVLTLLTLTGCLKIQTHSAVFRNRIKSTDVYAAECSPLNGADNYTLWLQSGQTLRVTTTVEKGTLRVWVGTKNADCLYQSNGIESGAFELPISTSGQYYIEVQGTSFKGKFEFRVLTNEES